jgi:hypothetical protein
MPEFVACPACGCRVQMADAMLGRPVRCISCGHRFTASSPSEPETRRVEPLPAVEAPDERPAQPRPAPPPLPPGFDEPAPGGWHGQRAARGTPGQPDDDRRQRGPELPCCPACGRRVPWEAMRCLHCGVELETDPGYARLRRRMPVRRDCEPHRGPLLAGMGNVTLSAGALTLCVAGLPLLVAVPLGITTWVMASNDLAKMRTGEMEPEGRPQTESARTCAITGLILSVFFAAGWGLLALSRLFP